MSYIKYSYFKIVFISIFIIYNTYKIKYNM